LLPLSLDQDLSAFNTLGLPSRAGHLLRLDNTVVLPQLAEAVAAYPRTMVLGGGSNVVLAGALPGLTIKVETRGIRLLEQTDQERVVEASAGEVWHDFVAYCLKQGWPGLENLALIPGTVGAAPVQNIGAYGVELDQRFHSLLAWDMQTGKAVEFGAADCQFAYRDSLFKREAPGRWLIVAVRFRLPVNWTPVLTYPDLHKHESLQHTGVTPQQVFDAVSAIRRSKLPDPAVLGNAGSFFKNPLVTAAQFQLLKAGHANLVAYAQPDGSFKLAAGWLIDQAGWKGRRLGAVGVHDRQALVLVNHGGATAEDVLELAEQIKTSVYQRFGVLLEQEPVVFR